MTTETAVALVAAPPVFGTFLRALDGEPMTWATLNAMNEAWHRGSAAREFVQPIGLSRKCASPLRQESQHRVCRGGFAAVVDGLYARGRCTCACHGEGYWRVRDGQS